MNETHVCLIWHFMSSDIHEPLMRQNAFFTDYMTAGIMSCIRHCNHIKKETKYGNFKISSDSCNRFVLLIKGADFFVEGSSSVEKKFNVPSLIIGMTIVAMGTSASELAVSVTASITGNNTLAVK